ncbi:MAG: uncharacterized protein JWL73_1629 [Actinomycetia bacterium]|nr:uncharacterized protein [Actinomycetes bacterium]
MTDIGQWLQLDLWEQPDGVIESPVIVGTAPVGRHVTTASGLLRAGAVAALIDCAGGLGSGLAALPGWVVSTNLSQRVATLDAVGPLAMRATILRAGRNAVVSAVQVRDEGRDRALVADGVLTSAILEFAGGAPKHDRPFGMGRSRVGADSGPQDLGIRPVDATSVGLELTPDLRNPWGILHGGAIALLADLAAEHAVTTATGRPSATGDLVVHYMAPGRAGPMIVATAERIGSRPDGDVMRVRIVDTGADDRLMCVAVAMVRPE